MTTVIREESALKGKSPTQKAKLIDKLVDGETAQLAKKVEEFRGRWRRVRALYLAMVELKTLDPRQARTPALARYHDALEKLERGDLKA